MRSTYRFWRMGAFHYPDRHPKMLSIFKLNSIFVAIVVLLGLTLEAANLGVAVEPSTTTADTPAQATPAENQPQTDRNARPSESLQQPARERREDRVYIDEIYPEYCRSYFHRRDWVGLFEYREGMYRCFHGVDRGFSRLRF